MKNKLIVIIGATCSKKSALAKYIYKKLDYNIVNCDIYKAYKYSDFWVNQIEKDDLTNPSFHLYSFIKPHMNMNVALYQKIARDRIKELLGTKSVVLLGGSCLYMNSIIFNEYSFNKKTKTKKPPFFTNFFQNTLIIGLKWKRETLYNNINQRVENLSSKGLETPKLIYESYRNSLLAKAIGYKEWFPYFENMLTKNEVLEGIKKNTRNYAKRQLTWYRNQYDNVKWFDISNENFGEVFQKIIEQFILWK